MHSIKLVIQWSLYTYHQMELSLSLVSSWYMCVHEAAISLTFDLRCKAIAALFFITYHQMGLPLSLVSSWCMYAQVSYVEMSLVHHQFSLTIHHHHHH